jgi:hypothetical protein
VGLFPSQPGFDINPASPQRAGSPVGTLQAIDFINCPFTVKQNGEISASFIEPLLHGGECTKGNNEDVGIEFCKFGLLVTQLCDMLAAGYSAKMAEKDEQDVSAFEDFAKRDLFTFSGGEGESGGRCVEFQVSGSRFQVWRMKAASVSCVAFYSLGDVLFCPYQSLKCGEEDEHAKNRKQPDDVSWE